MNVRLNELTGLNQECKRQIGCTDACEETVLG